VFAGLMLAIAVPTVILLFLDDRTWREVAIWAKPLKFMLSTAAFSITTAWFVGLLPEDKQRTSTVHCLAWVIVITSTFEVGYITLQAALGVGSHHNVSDQLHASLFGLMAIAAVALTATQAVLAALIWRYCPERDSVFVRSVIIGLVLTFCLATASGFILGAQQPPAGTGLPLVGWHMAQADARPAHFLGVHAHQLIPLWGFIVARFFGNYATLSLAVGCSLYVILWVLGLFLYLIH
jgi:hypothetical protein